MTYQFLFAKLTFYYQILDDLLKTSSFHHQFLEIIPIKDNKSQNKILINHRLNNSYEQIRTNFLINVIIQNKKLPLIIILIFLTHFDYIRIRKNKLLIAESNIMDNFVLYNNLTNNFLFIISRGYK